MVDKDGIRFFNVVASDGKQDKSLGVVAINDHGEFGFANETDEKPYSPAGGEKALSAEGVAESLVYDHFQYDEGIKLKETISSKANYQTTQAEKAQNVSSSVNATDELTVNSIEAVSSKNKDRKEPKKEVKAEQAPTSGGDKPKTSNDEIQKDQLLAPADEKTKLLVPAEVEKNFVKVGRDFHFKDSPEKLAFKDKGNALSTRNDGGTVSQSMIAIAKDRGWSEIKVTGSQAFKKDIWKKATEQGIAVRGYKPTKVEMAEMDGKGVDIPKQGQSLSPEKKIETPEQQSAKAFKEMPAAEAVNKHPSLAPYLAAVAAIEKKIETEKLSDHDKQAIMQRVRDNAEASIEQGAVPNVSLKGKEKTLSAQQALSR